MFKKVLLIVSVGALVLVFGAVNVFADTTSDTPDMTAQECPAMYNADEDAWVTAYYCDGRINAHDVAQTVAVYYDFTSAQTENDDGEAFWIDEVSAVNLWVIDWNGVGQLALSVPASTIQAAMAAGTDAVIAQGNGVALGYSSYGVLWVTGPDGYMFTWEGW